MKYLKDIFGSGYFNDTMRRGPFDIRVLDRRSNGYLAELYRQPENVSLVGYEVARYHPETRTFFEKNQFEKALSYFKQL